MLNFQWDYTNKLWQRGTFPAEEGDHHGSGSLKI
jgi:hypothetical protein